MKKTLPAILITALLLGSAPLHAGGPRLSWGVEWGYTGTFLKTWQYNYIYSSGYRIIENDSRLHYFSNGSILANIGADLGSKVNLSLYSGVVGIYSKRWAAPIELRARWCPRGLQTDGPLLLASGAMTVPMSDPVIPSWRAGAGCGWRMMVYRNLSIDFLLQLLASGDHDLIRDPDTMEYVPVSDITRRNSQYWGVNFSVAFNF